MNNSKINNIQSIPSNIHHILNNMKNLNNNKLLNNHKIKKYLNNNKWSSNLKDRNNPHNKLNNLMTTFKVNLKPKWLFHCKEKLKDNPKPKDRPNYKSEW